MAFGNIYREVHDFKNAINCYKQALELTGDLRFIGATLLHTLSSATVGLALALSFYRSAETRRLAVLLGVVLAIVLHTIFNFFILGAGSGVTFWVFLTIWFGILSVLLLTERVKRPARDYC